MMMLMTILILITVIMWMMILMIMLLFRLLEEFKEQKLRKTLDYNVQLNSLQVKHLEFFEEFGM